MKGFKALRLSPQSPPSHPPPGCLSLAQGAYPCSAAPPEGEGPLPSGRGWWHCRVVLWRVRAARVQRRVPMPTCRPLRKERVPPFGGGWPACGRVLWLVRAYHCGHPTRGPVHPSEDLGAYTAQARSCLPFPGTPRPPLWGRVYGGIKVELAPGAVGGEWDWLGGFGVGPGAPCLPCLTNYL